MGRRDNGLHDQVEFSLKKGEEARQGNHIHRSTLYVGTSGIDLMKMIIRISIVTGNFCVTVLPFLHLTRFTIYVTNRFFHEGICKCCFKVR